MENDTNPSSFRMALTLLMRSAEAFLSSGDKAYY